MNSQSHYRYMRVVMMILRQNGVFALVKSLNSDYARSGGLKFCNFGNLAFYTATTDKLPMIIRAASGFVNKTSKLARFHAPAIYISATTFQGGQRAVFVDHKTDPSGNFAEFLNAQMFHTSTKNISILQTFYNYNCLHIYD